MLYHVEFARQPIVLEADGRPAGDTHVVKGLCPVTRWKPRSVA